MENIAEMQIELLNMEQELKADIRVLQQQAARHESNIDELSDRMEDVGNVIGQYESDIEKALTSIERVHGDDDITITHWPDGSFRVSRSASTLPFSGSTSGSTISIVGGKIRIIGKAGYSIADTDITPPTGAGFIFAWLKKDLSSQGVTYSASEPLGIGEDFQWVLGTYAVVDGVATYTPEWEGNITVVAPML